MLITYRAIKNLANDCVMIMAQKWDGRTNDRTIGLKYEL